jgi:hypothetical protein
MNAAWVCAGVTAVSAFVSLGFAVAAAVSSRGEGQAPERYALSRSIALAAVSVVALVERSHSSLLVIALAMVIVQALDAVVGVTIHNSMKTFGPAALALANLLALIWLLA